jgi:plasmid stabilization system protein ParE
MGPRRRRVVWSQGAVRDLDSGISYIAEDAPENAQRVLERVLGAAESLDELSDRGRVVPEWTDPDTRELLVEPFRLLYHVGESAVTILGLLHQRRDLERWRMHKDARGDAP